MLEAGALGRPRGMVWGGRREEGSGGGTHVCLRWIHFDIWQNQYNIVKFKNKIKLKKKRKEIHRKAIRSNKLYNHITNHSSIYKNQLCYYTFSSVQSLSRVQLFATPWTAAHQASLSINNSWSLLKLMSIESLMPSNHLILCCPLLLLPSIFPSLRIFSSESVLRIRWAKYWSSVTNN